MPRNFALLSGGLVIAVMLIVLVMVRWSVGPAGAETPYARFFPDPTELAWHEETEVTLWLQTNFQGAKVRVNSLELGLGNIELMDPATGHVEILGRTQGCLASTAVANDNGTPQNATDDYFDSLWLTAGAGVGIVACGESGTPADISLHDEEGAVLQTYSLTVLPPNTAPSFHGGYDSRCADAAAALNSNLGSPVAAGDPDAGDSLTYSVGKESDDAFFDVDSAGQITVEAALLPKTWYQVTLVVTDSRGASDSIHVTIGTTDLCSLITGLAFSGVTTPTATATVEFSFAGNVEDTKRIVYLRYRAAEVTAGASPALAGEWAVESKNDDPDLTDTTADLDGMVTFDLTGLTTDTAYDVEVSLASDFSEPVLAGTFQTTN